MQKAGFLITRFIWLELWAVSFEKLFFHSEGAYLLHFSRGWSAYKANSDIKGKIYVSVCHRHHTILSLTTTQHTFEMKLGTVKRWLFGHFDRHNSVFHCTLENMSLVLRKPVFGVSDQVRHKPGCTATEDCYLLEISDLGSRGIVLSVQRKQRRWSASRLPRSWSASLFSHMQKAGFLTTRLISFPRIMHSLIQLTSKK